MAVMRGPRKVLVAIHPPVADDVGVHARATECFTDLVHHQDIDVVDRQGGEVGEVVLKQGGFPPEDVPGVDGMKFCGPVEAVLEQGEAGENLSGSDHTLTHLKKHVFHDGGGSGVKGFR